LGGTSAGVEAGGKGQRAKEAPGLRSATLEAKGKGKEQRAKGIEHRAKGIEHRAWRRGQRAKGKRQEERFA